MADPRNEAALTADAPHPVQRLPLWKGMVLALCALQIGPALTMVTGYQLHWSGANAWVTLGAAALMCCLIGAAINYVARRHAGSGTLLSYVQGVLPHWAVCIVASTLLLGYVIGPSSMTMWAAAYVSSILLQFGVGAAASPLGVSVLVLLVAAFAGYCAYRGLELSARVSLALGLISVPIAIAITALAAIEHGLNIDYAQALSEARWTDLARGTFIALGSFVGFDGVCALASETDKPDRNVPRMLALTVVLLGLTNTLGAIFQTPVLLSHAAELEAGQTPTYVLLHAAGLSSAYLAVDTMLCLAEIAGMIAWLNLSALIVAAAARDNFLPHPLGAVNPDTGSPYNAVILLTLVSAIIPAILQALAPQTLLVSMAYVVNVLVLYWMVAYALVCAAVIVLHHRNGEAPGIAYFASLLAIVALAAVLIMQDMQPSDEVYALTNHLGLGLLAVGTLFLFASTRHRRDALSVIK